MTTRRQARVLALQFMFQTDLNPCNPEEALSEFWTEKCASAAAKKFCEDIVRGTVANLEKIDQIIQQASPNWQIRRMKRVDRNVMRLAICEMAFRTDIPAAVSINEAVEITRMFSDNESVKFVNGILDQVRKNLGLPGRAAGSGQNNRRENENPE